MNAPKTTRAVLRITRCLDSIAHKLWLLSYVALTLMMLLTTADVVGRYFFKSPVRDGLEMTEFLLVVTVASAMGFTQTLKGHIAVDLLTDRLSTSQQKGCEALGHGICLALFALFSWQAISGAQEKWHNGVTIGSYGLPLWPFYVLLALGCCVASLSFLADALKLCFLKEKAE
ncbi:MAG: TRAP transporter small permease [Desulfopila sp.]